MIFDLWPVYSGERFRASWPTFFYMELILLQLSVYNMHIDFPVKFLLYNRLLIEVLLLNRF